MNILNPTSPSKTNSFHSIFREQQQQLRKLTQDLSEVRQHSQDLRTENAQLQLALAPHHNLTTDATSKHRYRSAPYPAHIDIPGLASYEKHIQTLQRDKLCAKVELDSALSRVSELTETVDMLELQVDKIHREYRSKLIDFSNQSHLYNTTPYQHTNPTERVAREIRESYSQQLIDLRDRCKLYRSQIHTMRRVDKETKLKQILLEHTTRSCRFDQTCIDNCLSIIRRISGLAEADDPAILKACGVIQHTLVRLLPQVFQQKDWDCYPERGRECPQSELVGQYDHLVDEIKLYKL